MEDHHSIREQAKCVSVVKVSDYVTSANITLAKVSHLSKSNIHDRVVCSTHSGPAYVTKSMSVYAGKVENNDHLIYYPNTPHIIFFNLCNSTMESIPLLLLFYRWGKLRYREDIKYPNITQSTGCG